MVTSRAAAVSYLFDGHGVAAQARTFDLPDEEIRRLLRGAGITVPPGQDRERIGAACHDNGFDSFDAFVRAHGARPIKTQARILEVPRGSLGRVYDAYGRLVDPAR